MMNDIQRISWFILGTAFLLVTAYFFPWKDIQWGQMTMEPVRTLTVTGSAESKEKNQIAKFSAGMSAVNGDREAAVKEVNTKIEAITKVVKEFGIKDEDIITQSMSIYQMQDMVYEDGRQRQKPGQWSVSNNIEVTLRDIDRANTLADLLSKSGATNVWGPNFQLDRSNKSADALTEAAVADAKTKAEAMAKSAGATLGRVMSVTESMTSGGIVYPMAMRDGIGGGGGGASLEPGTSNVSKSVTVIWELK
ncbi:hypothetical protein A2572_03000 [Candidatus Collierbacteria bacterium RIFOXYD1_FULL_40_9]|uniref:SIMPL domain-containing protein n=1 Tax=Candidatus Collierbacteria bacterium RIFOXYD1_FULL_40_9 TaxID=1817731 RepID=A0A1F5FWA3_9BACT|nr:MAG: hypothetical protein A2572_03000 [Candidatus Collierbacteria bacterium RIFOXYD1_FULL_40_9]